MFCFFSFFLFILEVLLVPYSLATSLKLAFRFLCLHTVITWPILIDNFLSTGFCSCTFLSTNKIMELMNILKYLPNLTLIKLNCLRLFFVHEHKTCLAEKARWAILMSNNLLRLRVFCEARHSKAIRQNFRFFLMPH